MGAHLLFPLLSFVHGGAAPDVNSTIAAIWIAAPVDMARVAAPSLVYIREEPPIHGQ